MKTALCALLLAVAAAADTGYRAEIEAWREKREERLKADGGWLSVAGLTWLKPGKNPVGTGEGVAVPLPAGTAPARAGVFTLQDGRVTLALEPGVLATVEGQPVVSGQQIKADTSGEPDVVRLGRLTLHVIERSGQWGIRLKDPEAPQRKAFEGLSWYPIDESARVVARWVPYDPPKQLPIPNVLGQVNDMPSPGRAVFTMAGRELSLEPVLEDPKAEELFFIFRDETAPRETYGAGRFLYAAMPKDGQIVLDFNKAYSPPCAFTNYATCPLPPKQNRLPVRIEAGEKDPGLLH